MKPTAGQVQGGVAFTEGQQVVVVHEGQRGPRGLTGEGEQGLPGQGINVRGMWVSGNEYCPNDAVTAQSTLVTGVLSLYIQNTDTECSTSTIPPAEDLTRWSEVGAYNYGSAFGGIWEVHQPDHGFTMAGTPIGFSSSAKRYVEADARTAADVAIAVVREVVSDETFVAQSTGEVPYLDPGVLVGTEEDYFEAGKLYYVASERGRLTDAPPTNTSYYTNPIIKVTDLISGTDRKGVALPWVPTSGLTNSQVTPAGLAKFYYTATDGQTVFTGNDRYGNALSYTPGVSTDVYYNGLNLDVEQYVATNGTSIAINTPATAGALIEIHTLAKPDLLVPAGVQKLDNIESQFDGSLKRFALAVAGNPVSLQASSSFFLYLDGQPQEAQVDYIIEEDPNNAGKAQAVFTQPPAAGVRFWGLATVIVIDGQAPGGNQSAAETSYQSPSTGPLSTATNVQVALDLTNSELANLAAALTDIDAALSVILGPAP